MAVGTYIIFAHYRTELIEGSCTTVVRCSWCKYLHCLVCVLHLFSFPFLNIPSMVLETGIFASQAIWLWRVRHVRREAKKAGMTYDQYVAQYPSKKLPQSDSQETVVDVEACHESKEPAAYPEKVDASLADAQDTESAASYATSKPTMLAQDPPQKPPAALTKTP